MSTIASYVGDGVNRQFDIPFDYRSRASIYVSVEGATVPFVFLTDSRVQTTTAPAVGADVAVYRQTAVADPDVVFQDGQVFRAAELNAAIMQPLDRTEELASETAFLIARALLAAPGSTAPALGDLTVDGRVLVMVDGKVEAQDPLVLVSNYLTSLASLGEASNIYRTKALATAAVAGVTEGAFVQVLVDETRSDSWAIYQKVAGVLDYVSSLSGSGIPLVIGTNVQAFNAGLTLIAALTTTSFGRSLLTMLDAPAALTELGAQPADADLTAIAALVTQVFGRSLLTAVDAAAGRALLGAAASAPTIQSVTSAATVTPTFANDQVNITAQAVALNIANPTGTAVDGWGIVIRIKDDGTARAITYGTHFRALGVTLPATTVLGKTLYLGMVFNAADTKWDVISVAQQA